jgi:hypothetical protein
MLLKLFHKIEKGRMVSNMFSKANIILIAKLDKEKIIKKKIIDQFPGRTLQVDIFRTYLQTEFDIILKTSHAIINENES